MSLPIERFQLLVGPEAISKLASYRVAVIGLGGVGGPALECLVRCGVKQLLLIDADYVTPSNLNRQVLYGIDDVGILKIDAATRRIKALAKDLSITTSNTFIDDKTVEILNQYQPQYIVDAIDSVQGKTALVTWASKYHAKVVSSLGMGNRLNPALIKLTTLDKTSGDPLAKAFRLSLRNKDIQLDTVNVVFSTESPLRRAKPVASYMAVTASAGLMLAHFIIDTICKRQE